MMAITILPHEPGKAFFINRDHSHGAVLELDHAVNAGPAAGIDHLVFPDTNPWIAIGLPGGERFPRIRHGGLRGAGLQGWRK